MPDPVPQQDTGTSTPPPAPSLEGLRTRPVQPSTESLGQTLKRNLTPELDTSNAAKGPGHFFDQGDSPQQEGEQAYREKFGSVLEQAYGHAKQFLQKHEGKLSEKYLAPFRTGLDNMASDLQHAAETGHTESGGQLNPVTRGLVAGTAGALRIVPVGKDVKETVAMSVVPPELGPEAKALSRELKAGEKVAAESVPNLEGIRSREVSPATPVKTSAKELPPQPRLPDTGTHAAIKTDDGSIYFDDAPEKQRTHIILAQDLGIPPERVVSGGWLKDGEYEGSERSDAGKWGERARAKAAIEEKRTGRAAGEAPDLTGLRTREISPATAVESSAKEAGSQTEQAAKPWEKYPATENLTKQAEERGNELVFRRVRSPEEAQAILESLDKGRPHEGFRTASIIDGHALSTKAPKIQAAIKKGAVPVFTSPYPTAANWYKGGADMFVAIEHTPEGKIYTSSRAGQTQGASYSATFPDAEHVIDARSIKNVSVLSPEQVEQIAEHEKNFEAGVRKGQFKGAYKDVDPELARANIQAARNLSPVVKSLGRPFIEAPIETTSGLKVKKGDRVRFASGATGVLSDFREFTPEQSTGFWKGEKHGFGLTGVKGELPANCEGETQDSARLNQMGRDITAVWDKGNKKWVEPEAKAAPKTEPTIPLHEKLFSEALKGQEKTPAKAATRTTLNASGESAASQEAINRASSEKAAGTKRVRIDTRSGKETPTIGTEAADAKASPYEVIVQRTPGKRETLLDSGRAARPYKPMR